MCQEFNELPTERFTGAPQGTFYIKLSVNSITSKDDVNTWRQWFTTSSNIKYNVLGGYKWKGVKMMYAQWFICQCKCTKLTKKQAAEKEAAARREKRHGTHKDNSGKEQCNLHLLTKSREKKTNCESKVSVFAFLPTNKWTIYVKVSFDGTITTECNASIQHPSARFCLQQLINFHNVLSRALLPQKHFIIMKHSCNPYVTG